MKKGSLAINKLVLFLIVVVVLSILAIFVLKISNFKELFTNLLESFK